MNLSHIRNFSIIAHIDHGKSTLADRMLELTHTIEKRKMMNQVLDNMELEREKGITIKMRPVKMHYTLPVAVKNASGDGGDNGAGENAAGEKFELNLIDTPGHIDFSYEVSRALKAVEGCILLVDATQGVQAQTLTTLRMAQDVGLTIIPVLSKVDSPLARIKDIKDEMVTLLGCKLDEIMETSGKTGQGVDALLQEIIKRIPAPKEEIVNSGSFRGLVFDFQYSNHKGVIVYVRVMEGSVTKNAELLFKIAGEKFYALEVGIFTPEEVPAEKLEAGQTGYIVTGIKRPGIASVGDTITLFRKPLPELPGYMSPSPVVWASVYPEDANDFELLKQALGKLSLSDSAFSYEEESSGSLGRGFRCGFLGLLHLEIITERLKREFQLTLVIATPSITYEVTLRQPASSGGNAGKKTIMVYSPSLFPEHGNVEKVSEPWVTLSIISPAEYTGAIYQLLYDHEAELGDTISFGDGRAKMLIHMPLRELMRNFFDELKSISSGYASLSYEFEGMRDADVTRMDILVADEPVEAFTRVVAQRRVEEEANKAADRLFAVLPRQMFTTKIQAQANGRIIASRTLSAMKKDVTGYLYGGDITRKMKLREKQKKGKKKMQAQHMEKATEFEQPSFEQQQEETHENKTGHLKEVWRSTLERAGKWLNMMTAVAVMYGGAFASDRSPAQKHEGAHTADKKPKPEKVSVKTERGGSFEFNQIEKAEKICINAGFDVDKYAYAVSIHIPPGEVEKAIIFLGQEHKGANYDKKPKGMDGAVQNQKNLFSLLKYAAEKTQKPVTCMVEGVVDEAGANLLVTPPEVSKSYWDFVCAVGDSQGSIKSMVDWELKAMKESVGPGGGGVDPFLGNNLGLFEILDMTKNAELSKDVPDIAKPRLREFLEKMTHKVNEDPIMYQFGGPGVASACGYVKVVPAESLEANQHVFANVAREVGITYNPNENLYNILEKMTAKKRQQAWEAISKYAFSKEREMSVLALAEKNLIHTNSVVLAFGNDHDFSERMDELYKEGKMKNTAVVKIDSTTFRMEEGKEDHSPVNTARPNIFTTPHQMR